MNFNDLIAKFSNTAENQQKAIFSTLFIAGNKLQTLFDKHIPEILGCSRQNIKKLADVLMKKGFITIQRSPLDTRAMCICPTDRVNNYFQNDFSKYQGELKYLFEVYTDKEIETLFILLSKLYTGIEHLEKEIHPYENSSNL